MEKLRLFIISGFLFAALNLGGDLTGVPSLKAGEHFQIGEVEAAEAKRIRRLWGNGKGRFKSAGRYASATVRG